MVSRNQADAVRRTVDSLARDPGSAAIEILVVDNGSSDGGERLDTDYPNLKLLRMQKNFGWTKAANVGMRTATGEFLCITAPGVEFEPGTIGQLTSALAKRPSALALCPLAVDAQGTPVTRIYPLPDAAMFSQFWKTGRLGQPLPLDLSLPEIPASYVTGTPVLMRRQSMVGMNYLDGRYGHFWADAEICAQIARASRSIVILPEIRVTGTQPYQAIPEKLDSWGAQLSADAALGGAAYLSKYSGFLAGFGFRVKAALLALLSIFSLRQVGPKATRFANLLAGQKIDGNQDG